MQRLRTKLELVTKHLKFLPVPSLITYNQATLIGGGGGILKYPPPSEKFAENNPLKILGNFFRKTEKNEEN